VPWIDRNQLAGDDNQLDCRMLLEMVKYQDETRVYEKYRDLINQIPSQPGSLSVNI